MKKAGLIRALFVFLFMLVGILNTQADVFTLNPNQDGTVGTGGVLIGPYVLAAPGSGEQGDVIFSLSSISGAVTSAVFSINPYALPLFGLNVAVYGFPSTTGLLDVSQYNSGTYLGTMALPSNLWYGQDAYIDVTAIFTNLTTPYVGFDLRSDGSDVFSSTEYNYGQPSQLIVTTVPEPSTIVLAGFGLMALSAFLIPKRS